MLSSVSNYLLNKYFIISLYNTTSKGIDTKTANAIIKTFILFSLQNW